MSDRTPLAKFLYLRDYNNSVSNLQKHHPTRRMCVESRWPFTGDLTPEEIVCMRDTYCGKRRKPSIVKPRTDYDRVFHPVEGWVQKSPRDTREHLREIQISARDEDALRTVPVGANSIYGKYLSRFIDVANNLHPRQSVCTRQFFINNPAPNLPPIRDLGKLPNP